MNWGVILYADHVLESSISAPGFPFCQLSLHQGMSYCFQKNHFTLTHSDPSEMLIIYFERNGGIIHLANCVNDFGGLLSRSKLIHPICLLTRLTCSQEFVDRFHSPGLFLENLFEVHPNPLKFTSPLIPTKLSGNPPIDLPM